MASPAFQAAGIILRGSGSITPQWPTHQTNDVALLFVETANEAATLTTPNGFVEITGSPQGTGTAGTSAATRLTVFWCRATSASMAAPVVADSGDHQVAVICTFRGCITTGNPWDVTAGGVQSSATTNFSIPGATTTVDECLVVLALTNNGNSSGSQVGPPPVNANLASIIERLDSQPETVGNTILRVGPYAGMTDLVGIGPGGDTGAPYYRVNGINPHSDLAGLQGMLDTADALDITLFATTPDSPAAFGANTATGFDFVKYKAKIDVLAAIPNFVDAVQRGRVVALVGDEPYHSKWNNSSGVATWTPDLVNQASRYHKTKFGSACQTVIRADLDKLVNGWGGFSKPVGGYDAVDYGVMQFEGPQNQSHLTFAQALATARTQAASINVGVVPAINLWAGGNHVLVDGISQCWDYAANGTSSGVIAGTVQGSPSPYTQGQQIACATWNATATAGKKTLAMSPAWLHRIMDTIYNDADIPWLCLWAYVTSGLGTTLNNWAGPLQSRSDYVTELDYAVNKGLSRPSFNGLRTPKT